MTPHILRIDALRGIAILMVLQRHIFAGASAWEYLDLPTAAQHLLHAGTAGVDLFFVLSPIF